MPDHVAIVLMLTDPGSQRLGMLLIHCFQTKRLSGPRMAQVPELLYYILRMADAATPAGSASSRPASVIIPEKRATEAFQVGRRIFNKIPRASLLLA